MPSIDVSGTKTFIQNKGTGKTTLAFVHGAAHNHRVWSRQITAMSTINRMIAVDLPGHGASSGLTGGQRISIQAYADHLNAILSALKVESTVVVGHSMGGAISMRYALDHPKSVRALVLVGTGAKLGVNQAILDSLSTDFEQAIRVGIGAWAFAESTDKRVVEEGIKEMLKCKQAVALADFKACNEFDIRESVSNIQSPTLIIVGEEDKLTPVKWSEFLNSRIRESELRIVEAAGHMVMLEKPREVSNAMSLFVKRLDK